MVVSPHFDDAVQGAGYLVGGHPGSTVITVFGGRPPAYPEPPSEWDALGGFRSGDDVVGLRRDEDAAALSVLGAHHRWLDFADHQYLAREDRPSAATVAVALLDALDVVAPTAVFAPFGLGNPDHDTTHQAARLVMDERPGWSWFCYEDAGYCHLPGLLGAGGCPVCFEPGVGPPRRSSRSTSTRPANDAPSSATAPNCRRFAADYRLDERLAALVPEQYWRVAPPPDGWDALIDLPG